MGVENLLLKREDLSGFAMGGNKPRQLEPILAEALADGADALITTAAAQSNFCQTTAAAAAHLGLRCVLLLRGSGTDLLQGNLLLDHVFGAEVEFVDTDSAYDPALPARLAGISERLRAEGCSPYVIHLTAQTGPLGAAGATGAASELDEQFRAMREAPDTLYLATGSGLTASGIVLGFKHLRLATRVVGISVQQPASFLGPLMVERANQAAALLGIPTRIDESDFDLDDGFIGPGYGQPSMASLDAIHLAGRHAGMVLDPGYSGKALAGLVEHLRTGRRRREDSVVFIHTGGSPNLFLHADSVGRTFPSAPRRSPQAN